MSKLSIKWQKIIVWFVAYLGILCFGLSPVSIGSLVLLAFLGASIYLIKKAYKEEVLDSVKVALLFVITFFVLLGLFYIIGAAGANMRIAILVVNLIAFVVFILFCILDVLGVKFVAKIPAIFGLSEKAEKEVNAVENANAVEQPAPATENENKTDGNGETKTDEDEEEVKRLAAMILEKKQKEKEEAEKAESTAKKTSKKK